jgi:type III pantothenate kinase
MMGAALAWGTSGVRAEGGRFARFPTNTADAAHSGALQAIAGAAERMVRELEGQEGDCALVLSGGNARELAGLLNRPLTLVDNLVLEGLINIAREGVSQ